MEKININELGLNLTVKQLTKICDVCGIKGMT